jgi:histidinol-phosphate/aromatic aminotransferase/cobyric acid decarboxylase-like protein
VSERGGMTVSDAQIAQRLRDWSVRVRHRWSVDLLQQAAARIDALVVERDKALKENAIWRERVGAYIDAVAEQHEPPRASA